MTFGKAGKFNVLQTSRIIHNLSNDVFISNNIINRAVQKTWKAMGTNSEEQSIWTLSYPYIFWKYLTQKLISNGKIQYIIDPCLFICDKIHIHSLCR